MALGRPFVLFALMLCMGVCFAPQQASAHALDHFASGAETQHTFSEQETTVVRPSHDMIGEMAGRCCTQTCCGSACHSNGYIITDDTLSPKPFYSVTRIALSLSSETAGQNPAGIRRPPRV